MKRVGKLVLIFLLLCGFIILLLNSWMLYRTQQQIKTSPSALQFHPIGLVLGTSKYVAKGKINPFYKQRINGAIQLFNQHKIAYILVSGDNRFANYNEPITMWRDLRKAGIPTDKIVLDYAGFRTLDSVIRAKKVFGAENLVIITQHFHCPRALYIADYSEMQAECYAVAPRTTPFNLRLREVLARVLTFVDLYLLHKQPYFLGAPEPIIESLKK